MKNKLSELIGLEVDENVPLKNHTTFKIGGPAKFFVVVESKDKLFRALAAAKELKLNYLILGGGSNVLVSDDGFDGLVIKLKDGELQIKENQVTVFAGNNMKSMIIEARKSGLGGLEFAANIPGTIGGAVRGNAGAYGQGVGDFVESIEIIEIGDEETSLKVLSSEQCEFSYRESIIKKNSNWMISEVKLKMVKKSEGEMKEEQDVINKDWDKRCSSQPYDTPSAGCTFKNVIYSEELLKYKDWETHGKIAAGRFVEEAGLKGEKIGGAMVSEKHANFIINYDNANAEDVITLISLVKARVRDQFGVQLFEEIMYVGF
jgi:UDP-N-acetylmuramate dehydrogenase